jgi:Mg-chelatase subunit ChlD
MKINHQTLHINIIFREGGKMAKQAVRNHVANSQLQHQSTNNNQTKFTLYNLAGIEKAYYLVEQHELKIPSGDRTSKAVAHSIIIIDRSGSMYYDIQALKDRLIKLLTLDEYINFQLVVTLISYSSKDDLTCHFQRVPIQELMRQSSPYLQEIQKIKATYLTCISQAMQLAKTLVKANELTAITLHSDGYANDSSPSSEVRALEEICEELKSMDVFVNTIAYSQASDFKLLAKIANTVSGVCIQAGNVKAVYDAIYSTSKLLDSNTAPAFAEPLAANYQYQVFISRNAKKINGASGSLRFCGIDSQDGGTIYKYKRISEEEYAQLHVPVQQSHESVYAFARANLAQGNLNTAKYAAVSTFDATLCHRNIKALTNHEIANFMQDLDITLFDPNTLQEHTILNAVQVNTQISFLEVINLLEQNCHSIIVNIKDLQDNYQRTGIKRLKGSRDIDGNLIKPWLTTQYIDVGEYVGMGSFEINRNTATINMLVKRQVRLVKAEDKTPIIEVAGLLVNDLYTFNNYTIVSDGEINIKSLKIKISNKKTFDLLKASGVISAKAFDFRDEHIVNFENLPLVTFDKQYNSIDGLFYELASMKVLKSIIAAHLKQESDVFLPEQLEELKKHYLSKNLYLNLPTTNEYNDLKTALATGTIDTRISYKIDIGSKDILNLSKLHSANKFLDRMYRAYDIETGELFQKATFEMALNANIAFRHKSISSRMKITSVDVFMKPIFDDFLGLEDNGSVAAILQKAGANSLARLLEEKQNHITKEEMVAGLTAASAKLENYIETVYRENISPLVFYIGSTGLLPDEMDVKAMTADEIAAKYPNLQFSEDEEEGTFFEVANSIISVYAKPEYYSKKVTVAVED